MTEPLPQAEPNTPDAPVNRRGFLRALAATAGAASAALGGYIVYRFIRPATSLEAPAQVVLQTPADYPEGRTFVPEAKAFIERSGTRLRCVSASCTHLGCLVNWNADVGLYHCACHGSDFSPEGLALSGPASRPLPYFHLALDSSGRLIVDRRRTQTPGSEWLDLV